VPKSAIPVYTSQFWWEYFTSDDVTPIPVLSDSSYNISDINLSIALWKNKPLVLHIFCLIWSLILLCHLYIVPLFFCGLILNYQVCVRSFFYPRMERCYARGNNGSRIEWDVGPRFSSSSETSNWLLWVYIINLNLDGSLARLKACLVAKGYSQMHGID